MARARKKSDKEVYLSPREQQIMEIVYRQDRGVTAMDVVAGMPDDLSNSAVRTFLRILEQKGHLKHEEKEGRFVYKPVRPRTTAARVALRKVLATYYDGSVEKLCTVLLTELELEVGNEERERLRALLG
jgi:BlaI family transcriptional regulator, penicillinase repressor